MFRMLATVDCYTSIGVKLVRQNEEDGEINWAKLTFGNSEIMFDADGVVDRRDVPTAYVRATRAQAAVLTSVRMPSKKNGGA